MKLFKSNAKNSTPHLKRLHTRLKQEPDQPNLQEGEKSQPCFLSSCHCSGPVIFWRNKHALSTTRSYFPRVFAIVLWYKTCPQKLGTCGFFVVDFAFLNSLFPFSTVGHDPPTQEILDPLDSRKGLGRYHWPCWSLLMETVCYPEQMTG